MSGSKHFMQTAEKVSVIARENPCGWSDYTMDMIASAIDLMFSEKTKAGVSMQQVADYYKVTIRTIQRWRNEYEDFPVPIDPYAKTLMFPTDAVVEWKQKHISLF